MPHATDQGSLFIPPIPQRLYIINGIMIIVTLLLALVLVSCNAFQVQQHSVASTGSVLLLRPTTTSTTTYLQSSIGGDDSADLLTVKNYLKENYPGFSAILETNDGVWKALGGAEGGGFTLFAPSQDAFSGLDAKKQEQLLDPRNLETTQKIGAYHVIAELVTPDDLFNAGGVVTLGGEVPVDRSRSGGVFGMGGQEDGGMLVQGKKVTGTVELGSGILYEVDGLINPSIMWRYMDQLRIPGST